MLLAMPKGIAYNLPGSKTMKMNKDISAAKRKAEEQQRLEALLDHLGTLLPETERTSFRHYMLVAPPPTIRLNPLQPATAGLAEALAGRTRPVPWCADAFEFTEPAPPLGHCLEHLLGGFYIQAKATTLAVEALGPKPGERVLDLAASPGGKTTQIAAAMGNSGLLLANDFHRQRMSALVGNIERCHATNTVLSQAPGTLMARYFHNFFDRVLLDAPCSGDGIVNKNLNMLRYWSPEDARNKANMQKGLLRAAFHMLKPGGTLVYSTCSLSLEENEDVVLGLMEKYPGQVDLQPIACLEATPLPPAIAAAYPPQLQRAVRIWPHHHHTEGAFVACIRKNSETQWHKIQEPCDWTPPPPNPEAEAACQRLGSLWGMEVEMTAETRCDFDGKYLVRWPLLAPGLKSEFPHFLRAGIKLAKPHRDHLFLTQQAVGLWGHRSQAPALELDWEQTRTLFSGQPLHFDPPLSFGGETLCRFGAWTLCRGVVEAEGRLFSPHLTKSLRTKELCRLV
jgi:16S rRNA (cytosine1407-C5)-methyltransferase